MFSGTYKLGALGHLPILSLISPHPRHLDSVQLADCLTGPFWGQRSNSNSWYLIFQCKNNERTVAWKFGNSSGKVELHVRRGSDVPMGFIPYLNMRSSVQRIRKQRFYIAMDMDLKC